MNIIFNFLVKNIPPVSALLIFAIILAGCPKPCIEANYSFSATAQYSPDLDIIRVRDTLFLSSTIPNSLLDQRTGQNITYNTSTGSDF